MTQQQETRNDDRPGADLLGRLVPREYEETGRRKLVCAWLALSVLLWAILSDAWGYSNAGVWSRMADGWGTYAYGYMSRAAWAAPFLLLILHRHGWLAYGPDVMFRFRIVWRFFLTVVSGLTVLIVAAMFWTHGRAWINLEFPFWRTFLKYASVGVVEELVYRGLGLNALLTVTSARLANIVQSLFFAALHVPAHLIHWLLEGTLDIGTMATQLCSAFLLGLVLGETFRRSRSLWPAAIAHAWYDLAFVLFVK